MVDTSVTQIAYSPQEAGNEKKAPEDSEFSFFGDDGFTFLDFVDMVNPLQHIPFVGTAYRQITGDELDPGSRLAGGTLFGGPIGLAASAFNVILENNTGMDAGEHVVAWFDGDEEPVDNQTMMADSNANPAQNHSVSSFAPVIPESEADAFAAGEASLRMAELQQFMSPTTAKEVPSPARGAGSAGTWAPPLDADHPFPTERPANSLHSNSLFQAQQQPLETAQIQAQTYAQARPVSKPEESIGFKAKQSHTESLDALRAFARDIKAQKETLSADQEIARTQPAQSQPQPPVTNTSRLNQTNDNAWFANMMSQNMDRYAARTDVKG